MQPTASVRRHVRRACRLMALVALLVVLAAVAVNASLLGRVDRIDGAFDGLGHRPASAPGETILMLGTRPDDAADIVWLTGVQSVEAVMLVEIDPDGSAVRVLTLPDLAAVAASFTSRSASETVAAVESWSGRRVDHLLSLDWRTFADLAAGNRLSIPYQNGSPPWVQHAYLQHVLEGTLETELRRRPVDLYRTLHTTASGAAIDREWSVLELDHLLITLRGLRSHQIEFSMARPR